MSANSSSSCIMIIDHRACRSCQEDYNCSSYKVLSVPGKSLQYIPNMSLRSVRLVTPRLFTRTRIAAFSTCTRRFDSHSTSDPLRFSVGVGYSGKDTPPFVSRERANEAAKKGFQPDSKIGRWKREMMALGGGRVELFDTMQESKEDDWTRENSGLADRRRWGSGEDSFFVNESVSRGYASTSEEHGSDSRYIFPNRATLYGRNPSQ